MIRNPIDCTPIIVKLSLQDIRNIDKAIYYAQDALRMVAFRYKQIVENSDSSSISDMYEEAKDRSEAFEKASKTLINAFFDGTANAGISSSEW